MPMLQYPDHSEVGCPINIVQGPRATRGLTRPQQGFELVAQAIEQADIDFINSAVPVEEHQAALHGEDFSIGSDISSEELTLAQGEADQLEFSQDLELELEWHMAGMNITRDSEDYIPSSTTSEEDPAEQLP